MLRARRTLFKTRRTMTSATVELRRDPKGAARRVVVRPVIFRRLDAPGAGLGLEGISRFLLPFTSPGVDVALAIPFVSVREDAV